MERLSGIRLGERVLVAKLCAKETMYRRLLDIGFTEGAAVTCLYPSPFGDPRAYLIRGTVIALRKEDADGVMILRKQ